MAPSRKPALVERCLARLAGFEPKLPEGVVHGVTGLLIEARGPAVPVGSVVEVHGRERVAAEVVGFRGSRILLMPYDAGLKVRLGDRVRLRGSVAARPSPSWIGRVLDGLGRPLDGGAPLERSHGWIDVAPAPVNPLRRRTIDRPFVTGVRAIDGLLTCGQGQRVGVFGGSGVGKSTLLAQMARGAEADLSVVALIGERGREVHEFVHDELGPEGLARSVVIASTSDSEPLLRLRAAETALRTAEAARDAGKSVLLILDSLTRVAMAQREIGLAIGEPPTSRGYTPSVFAALPRLIERAGKFDRGTITAFFTVLVEGDEMSEPVADAARGLLDGHIVLSRSLAERAHFPAIDISASLSRLMRAVAPGELLADAERLRRLLAAYRRAEDLIAVGAYAEGSDPFLDEAVLKMKAIDAFLRQRPDESAAMDATRSGLAASLADS